MQGARLVKFWCTHCAFNETRRLSFDLKETLVSAASYAPRLKVGRPSAISFRLSFRLSRSVLWTEKKKISIDNYEISV